MLDEVSRAIGQLEATTSGLASQMTEVKGTLEAINSKLDKLAGKQSKLSLTWKHWVALAALSSSGGGAVAHVLRKVLG